MFVDERLVLPLWHFGIATHIFGCVFAFGMECNLKVPLQPLLLWAGSGCHYWFETTGSNCCHMTHVIVLRWTFSIFHCALVDNDQKHVCFCGLNFGFNILDIIATFPASKQQRISVDVFCENWMQHFSMLQSTSLSSIVFLFKFCNVDWCETKWAIKLQKKNTSVYVVSINYINLFFFSDLWFTCTVYLHQFLLVFFRFSLAIGFQGALSLQFPHAAKCIATCQMPRETHGKYNRILDGVL